jgi:DNA-binding NtrC family response regulator
MSTGDRAIVTLVVSDDRDTTSFLESSLSTLGFEVVVANSAMQALEELHSRQFDVVLAEFKMPRLGGEALWNELERRAPWALRNICFLTSDYTVQGIEAFLHKTGARYLDKPFTFDQLAGVINDILNDQQQQRAA